MRDKRFSIGLRAFLAILGLILLATGSWAATQTKVLHSFNGKDGYDATAGPIFDTSGNLFGTTEYGGTYDAGTVFELTPKTGGGWTEKVLHSFNDNGKDGYAPLGRLVLDAAGNIYGTTEYGGVHGYGTVFELTPEGGEHWTEKVLHSFNGKDGNAPFAGLIFDAAGDLYGTTYQGGVHGWGTVFELMPKVGGVWTEKVLHSFNITGKGGSFPEVGVILDAAGNLFGAATDVVFELTRGAGGVWREKVLHTFHNKYGTSPSGGMIFDAGGNLYGATFGGGAYGDGMAFELMPQADGEWTATVLHSFNGKDGTDCYASVIFDANGNLFGTTAQGGKYGNGTVFELTPKTTGGWTEKVLHSFNDNGRDGVYPDGGLIFDATGNLYGTTAYGGLHGEGTVFKITP
jgi:uncharacterized repeat protein (TIGR03803 family)